MDPNWQQTGPQGYSTEVDDEGDEPSVYPDPNSFQSVNSQYHQSLTQATTAGANAYLPSFSYDQSLGYNGLAGPNSPSAWQSNINTNQTTALQAPFSVSSDGHGMYHDQLNVGGGPYGPFTTNDQGGIPFDRLAEPHSTQSALFGDNGSYGQVPGGLTNTPSTTMPATNTPRTTVRSQISAANHANATTSHQSPSQATPTRKAFPPLVIHLTSGIKSPDDARAYMTNRARGDTKKPDVENDDWEEIEEEGLLAEYATRLLHVLAKDRRDDVLLKVVAKKDHKTDDSRATRPTDRQREFEMITEHVPYFRAQQEKAHREIHERLDSDEKIEVAFAMCVLVMEQALHVHKYGVPTKQVEAAQKPAKKDATGAAAQTPKMKASKGAAQTPEKQGAIRIDTAIDLNMKCSERCEAIINVARRSKLIAIDIVDDERHIHLARSPLQLEKLKIQYMESNATRKIKEASKKAGQTEEAGTDSEGDGSGAPKKKSKKTSKKTYKKTPKEAPTSSDMGMPATHDRAVKKRKYSDDQYDDEVDENDNDDSDDDDDLDDPAYKPSPVQRKATRGRRS